MRALRLALLSAIAILPSACRDTLVAPVDASFQGEPVASVLTQSSYTRYATTSYTGGASHIAFATSGASTWDDIVIEYDGARITEDFNAAGGSWDASKFELPDPVTRPGTAAGGAYRSTGTTRETERGILRTVAQFEPTSTKKLVIQATLNAVVGSAINFLAWRSSGLNGEDPWEPKSSLLMRAHNFGPNITHIAIREGNSFPYNVETTGDNVPEDLYQRGPIRVRIEDDGSNIILTYTPIVAGPVYTSAGFLAPISKTKRNSVVGGSTVPLKFQVTLDGTIVSDLAAIDGAPVVTSCTPGPSAAVAGPSPADLQYLAGTRQFVLPWRVPRDRGCYTVTVNLVGGEKISADFEVRR